MQVRITGARNDDGKDVNYTIEVPTLEDARLNAQANGVLVEDASIVPDYAPEPPKQHWFMNLLVGPDPTQTEEQRQRVDQLVEQSRKNGEQRRENENTMMKDPISHYKLLERIEYNTRRTSNWTCFMGIILILALIGALIHGFK